MHFSFRYYPNPKYDEHQQALDQQSAQWASGIRLWTQATMTQDVVEASRLMDEALREWPSAPGARTEMLRRLYEETERAYIVDLIPDQRQQLHHMYALTQMKDPMPWLLPPDSHLPACLRWLTQCESFESNTRPEWRNLTAAKIHAMFKQPEEMFQYLERLPVDGLETADDATALVLLSALPDQGSFERLEAWWAAWFSEPLTNDFGTTVAVYRNSPDLRSQCWMVIPKTIGSSPGIMFISRENEHGWKVSVGPDTDQHFESTEDMVEHLMKQWIMLRPVPRFI